MIIYGIKNCDTMKKAFTWLNDNAIEYTFFDYKIETITATHLKHWLSKLPLEQIINTKSTTFKNLTDAEKIAVLKPAKALKIIQANQSIIKRPLVELNDKVFVGFNEATWNEIFK